MKEISIPCYTKIRWPILHFEYMFNPKLCICPSENIASLSYTTFSNSDVIYYKTVTHKIFPNILIFLWRLKVYH